MKALVLSGGGVKGAYQVGALKYLMGECHQEYDIVCGISVGALNAAGISQIEKGKPVEAISWLEDFWRTKIKGTSSIHKRWFPFGVVHSLWKESIYNSKPLIDLVTKNFDLIKACNNGRDISVGAVCLHTGEYRFVSSNEPGFLNHVLASSSFPVFLTPIEIEGKLWSDGGIVNVTPIGEAIKRGATDIDILMCSNPFRNNEVTGEMDAIPDVLFRMLDLMVDQIMRADIKIVGLKNDLAEIEDKYKNIKMRILMPQPGLCSNSLEFIPQEIAQMIEKGYQEVQTNFEVIC
jgi:NTE family protein